VVKPDLAHVPFFGPLKTVDIAAIRSRLCTRPGVPGFVEVKFELRRVPIGHAAASGKWRNVKFAALGDAEGVGANYRDDGRKADYKDSEQSVS